MRVTIRQKNLTVTPSLRTYIEAKISRPLQKIVRSLGEELPLLDLEFARTTRHHLKGKVYYAEANLKIGKHLLRVEVEDEDIRAACDILKDELESKIKKFKEKGRSLVKKEGRRQKERLLPK